MRITLLPLFFTALFSILGANRAAACHAIALVNFNQQTINANSITVNAASNSPTCGCAPYWLDLEVRCLNEPFDAAPFAPGFHGPLATYPYFQSAQMNKPNCVVQNYPGINIPFANLCPGMTYQYRMRENHHGQVGPWTPAQTFTVPGATQPIVAGATATQTTICAGDCVNLSASVVQGCGLAAAYNWDNGLGAGQNQTVCPTVTTTYTVTIDEQCSGFQDQASVTVNVLPPPVAGTANISATNVCAGTPVTVNMAGHQGNVQWQSAPNAGGPWTNIGGATAVPYVSGGLATSTCFRAEIIGCGGSVFSNVVCVTVDPAPIAAFNATTVCSGTATNFNNTSNANGGPPITNYNWDFGDGNTSTAQNPTHTYAAPGTYNVTLQVSNGTGCSDNITQQVTVEPDPTANFTSVLACPGQASNFTDQSVVGGGGTITGWNWDFGDGNTSTAQNPSNNYANPGNYNVTLTVTTAGGCTGTITLPVTVPDVPTANFSAITVCEGTATPFTDLSTIGTGAIATWNWDFGDGNTSTAQNPSHTYAAGGNYNVTLTVSSGGGCTDQITIPITVDNSPIADFTFPNPWCLSDPIDFTDASNGNGGVITNWDWDFGDGNTSTNQNPSHTYATAGPHNVSLTVTTGNGCTNTITQAVTLEPDPTPDFTFAPGCPGAPSQFTDASVAGGTATITGWDWDFGDGNTSTAQNPTNAYAAPGNYNVTLVVTSSTGCVNTITLPVTIPSGPAVDFIATNACDGAAASFADNTVVPGGNIVDWQWDFGDGNTGTGDPINHTYAGSGTYNVTLTATTDAGCVGSVTLPVTIYPNPIADFTFPNPFCAADPLPFTDASNGNGGTINAWDWDFGDGNTDNIQNPTHNYGGALGPFNASLTVTTTDGCVGTVTQAVTLEPAPTPDFTYVADCPGSATQFTDASVAGGAATVTSWTWDFGDGNTSTAQNPTNVYTNPGTYNVQLDIISSTGCSNTITLPVDVPFPPVAEIDMQNVCDGVVGNFNDVSTVNGSTITAWNWDMGDGTTYTTQNVTHTYGASTYNVTLTVTSAQGCVDDTVMSVTIFPNPIADFSPTTVCQGYATTLNDLTNPNGGTLDTWNWDIGDDGSVEYNTLNPTHTFPTAGTYNVELMVNTVNGCADSIVLPVTVDPTPQPDFTHVVGCPGFATTFTDASVIIGGATITDWQWDFGDGNTSTAQNPSNTYTAAGLYTVQLIVTGSSGCIDSISYQVDVPYTPFAEFTMANVCDGFAGNFLDASTVTNANITGWNWDMGDGTTFNTQNVTHTYANNNTYNVTLTVTSDQGCVDDTTAAVTVYPNPTADFTYAQACEGQVSVLTDASVGNGGTINTWYWDINNDGSVESTTQNSNATMPAAGNYDVELVVWTVNGCADSVVIPITVDPRPTADFTLTNVCDGQAATFTDISVIGTGAITGWEWDFGNGNNSVVQNPNETYAAEGVYSVELVVFSDMGCTDTLEQNVEIYPNPIADFSPQSVCLNVATQFSDLSTVSNVNTANNIIQWDWDFGDGNTSNVQNPAPHTYTNPGTYNISLTVTTDNGCTDNLTISADVYEKPVADFTFTEDCVNSASIFTDASTVTGSTIAAWSWNFGDGNTSNNQNPTHNYSNAGTYNVELIVESQFGCEDTVVYPVTSFPMPQASFTFNNECVYDSLCFTNTSQVAAPSTINSTVWIYGDGSPLGGGNNTCHLYNAAGTYNVQLIATSDDGCVDDTTITVTVHPQPVIDFTGTSVCINTPPNIFTNNSSIPTGSITQWNWNFGDGGVSPLENPSHTYGAPGTYNVTLIGISAEGCQDTLVQPVEVFEKPIADFIADQTEGCDPLEVNFSDNSVSNANSITSWDWDFGNGNTSNDANPANIVFDGSGTLAAISYDVQLIVSNDNGCFDTLSIANYITVHPDPIAAFSFDPLTTDEQNPYINFTNESITAETYFWDFGDGNTSTDLNPSHAYSDTGFFDVMLIASTQYGCVDTAYGSPYISPVPEIYVPNAFTPDDDGVNDIFLPSLYGFDNWQYELYIFDRWGQIIYESFTPSIGWDGSVNGIVSNSKTDVYVWKIVLKSRESGEQKEYIGHVTLIK